LKLSKGQTVKGMNFRVYGFYGVVKNFFYFLDITENSISKLKSLKLFHIWFIKVFLHRRLFVFFYSKTLAIQGACDILVTNTVLFLQLFCLQDCRQILAKSCELFAGANPDDIE
jgi:hypothetical protein